MSVNQHGSSREFTGLALPPPAQGLYDPKREHDACGVGFVADLKARPSHTIVQYGLQILENLTHRGAVGADPLAGDGAGMLVQMPHEFLKVVTAPLRIALPEPGHYAVGHMFMPRNEAQRIYCQSVVERATEAEGLQLLGWRDVPTDNTCLGQSVIETEPRHMQVFIGRGRDVKDESSFERKLYILRKVISNTINGDTGGRDIGFYTVSLSCRTLVYKGMFLAYQLGAYYLDLHHPKFASALALVHQRFSTNTFPSWKLAHPYRMVAHNGEINTLRGNLNWMAARQASVSSPLFGKNISRLWPISYEGQSDTACFDNALEFLVQGGYSLAHAAMMLIPEAWAGNPLMDAKRRAFYEYHACLMEPWDGPAAMAFTDGRQIGATLDRNGLRPARYFVTDEGLVVMASETGVLPFPEKSIVQKWRLQPGKMLLIDLEKGRIISDEEIKAELAGAHPYQQWLDRTQIRVHELPGSSSPQPRTNVSLLDRQQAFGYTQESVKFLMVPMAQTGQEAVGSMGTDTPISALSDRPKLLHTYFKQNFAQVTNPPIDPIREELVMSLVTFIGPRPNLLDLEGTSKQKRLEAAHPILTNENLERIRGIGDVADNQFRTVTLDMTYGVDHGAAGMGEALDKLCKRAEAAVRAGENIIILSDRATGPDRIPIPSLLATSAVHHHLIRCGLRTSVGLVVETGEAHEVHQFATLAGYGAEAINPYLAFETLEAMLPEIDEELTAEEAVKRYIKSVDKGLLKVMSKMGISTYQSYCGAQIFDAVGLRSEFVAKYFTGTNSQVEGIGLEEVARETVERHRLAFSDAPVLKEMLEVGGEYAYRIRGEAHMWRPGVVADLQHAVRGELPEKYRSYAKQINEQSEQLLTLRGMFRIKGAEESGRKPVPLDEVEPAKEIVKRFSTGAMSFGSISREAHTTLAIAMNRIGGKSNTGEGGEESDRYKPLPNGNSMRSKIKQVASGRFGVTTEYLDERRHDADQDGARRQARRRRTAPRPQGRRGDRQGAPFDAWRRPDLAAAASRHLFHRGSGPAHLRPEERQSERRRQRQARERGRRRHRCRRRRQGARRPCDHRRLRGRHRRFAAHLDQACRLPLGDRPCRDAADAGAEPPARPHRRSGRRRHPHRPRRGGWRSARRRRIRLRHGAADRRRLHHDAQVPPQHLPGRRRHARPGAARPLPGQARARHQFLLLRRRGSARIHGGARLPQLLRDDRQDRDPRQERGHRPLEGQGPRLHPHLPQARGAEARRDLQFGSPGPSPRRGARPQADRARASLQSRRRSRSSSIFRSGTPTAPPAPCCPARSPSCMDMQGCPRIRSG